MKTRVVSVLVVALNGAIACGNSGGHVSASGSSGAPRDGGAGATAPSTTAGDPAVPADAGVLTARMDSHPACALSADCPAGTHCDLGECAQSCSAAEPCPGALVCSPRGRCLDAAAKDEDLPPATASAGTVRADPGRVLLSDRDDTLRIHLVTTSSETVRYRVAFDAPYLSIDVDRGEFTGETVLSLHVDPTKLAAHEVTGSVRVFTTLGNVDVPTPIEVGLTARYHGVLSYDGTDSKGGSLGATRIDLSLAEKNGDVTAAIDPDHSLLFPAGADKAPVGGYGSYAAADGLMLTVKQVIPADLGGDENPFRRAVGRSIRFELVPGDRGGLDGTFEETLFGLFETPIKLRGHAHLERTPCGDPKVDCEPRVPGPSQDPTMPVVDASAAPDLSTVFPGSRSSDCPGDGLSAGKFYDQILHQPFLDRLGKGALASADPLSDLATDCRQDLAEGASSDGKCVNLPPLACALGLIESQGLGSNAYDTFATLYAHTLDVPLFVAEDDLVSAVKTSFLSGTSSEQKLLADARALLVPPAAWVLHPRLLEYLRGIAPTAPADGTEARAFTAGRTLAGVFYALSTIDAEAARLDAGDRLGDPVALRRTAQERSVLALFEAATLSGISESWTTTPPELTTAFIDFLTPMDRGFASLAEGSVVFGVPETFVPSVYDPSQKLTNFEEVLAIASARLDTFERDEAAFSAESREFEQSSDQLDQELESVGAEYDSQIEAACGDAIDLTAPDWTKCGDGGSGTVGEKLLELDQAEARVDSALGRARSKASQIDIETHRVADVKGIRDSTVRFTASTGDELDANIAAQGAVTAMEKFVEVASHADVLNGGAPLGEAVAMLGLEAMKTGLEVDRQDIQTRQDMQVQEDNALAEVVNGEATIKSMLVDLAQLQLETREATIGVLQARSDAENALADATRAHAERARALARVGQSSLRDPTARVLLSRSALHAMRSRSDAQQGLYLAGRALEYQLNRPMGDALGKAALNAFSADEATRMKACLSHIFDDSRLSLPAPQDYVTEVSVRKLLGVQGTRMDEVTGEAIGEGEQLRRILLQNENLDGAGGVGTKLSSNLTPGNRLWSSDVCDDRITQVEGQIVGDFLGDNEAELHLDLEGGGVIRRCDTGATDPGALMSWATSGHAVIQAGVNTFGTAPPNGSLQGLSVASAEWKLVIPGGSVAPSNADLDLSKIEDVVLRIHHAARPVPNGPWRVSTDCLAEVGAVH